MSNTTKHTGPHDNCSTEGLHEHPLGEPPHHVLTPDNGRATIFIASEEYAGRRVPQLIHAGLDMDDTTTEVVHDALMAAYQAGALGQSEGLSVLDAIQRIES